MKVSLAAQVMNHAVAAVVIKQTSLSSSFITVYQYTIYVECIISTHVLRVFTKCLKSENTLSIIYERIRWQNHYYGQ
jgi:hypothetical protein